MLSWFVVFRELNGFYCLLGLASMSASTSQWPQVITMRQYQQCASHNHNTVLAKCMTVDVFKYGSHSMHGIVSSNNYC